MKRLVRGLVAGSVIGAGVGLVMLLVRQRKAPVGNMQTQQIGQQARGTIGLVKDNAIRWSSAVKNGTEAISRRLARRSS